MADEIRTKKPVGTVAELFAGVGGFRLGLEAAGWKTIFSNQWEPSTKTQHASDVYVANFGGDGHANVDVATIEDIPDVDLLVGGFPCQDYSVAKSLNSSRGLEGKKGVLWWEILRLVSKKKPAYVFLENVDRLLKSPSSQRGRDFAVMLKTLGDEGYIIEWRVVSAADYGFPQRRIRVLIVAKKSKEQIENPLEFVTKNGVLARALPVMSSVKDEATIDLAGEPDEISNNFNQAGGVSPFLNAGVYASGQAFTFQVMPDFRGPKQVLGDILQADSDIQPEYFVSEARLPDWKFLKGAKSIRRTHKDSGVEYTYSEGQMAFPDLLTNPSRTILTGEGGSTPSRFKHIINTAAGFRRLTPVELERLNGFPDHWTAYGKDQKAIPDARRAFFMGNALVVGLIERVGLVLSQDFRK